MLGQLVEYIGFVKIHNLQKNLSFIIKYNNYITYLQKNLREQSKISKDNRYFI